METLMITTICITLLWHSFLKKGGGASNPPKHLCASKKRHLFLRHLARHHLADTISQKVILLQEQVHKDLSSKSAPWNCALCYAESFKESPAKSSTECKELASPLLRRSAKSPRCEWWLLGLQEMEEYKQCLIWRVWTLQVAVAENAVT